MSGLRSNRGDLFEQIHELVTARINDELTPEQFERLDALLAENGEARRLYVQYIHETLALPSLLGVDDLSALSSDSLSGDGAEADDSLHIVVKQSASQQQFVGSPLFSYSAALLILCAMLLSAWAYKVTHYQHIATDNSQETLPDNSREMQFVGQITGMKDCRWTDPNTAPYGGASVPLGRQYALDSGLLEITYKTGARVVLEGPCHYTVDSDAGGRLVLGKLVARVEKKVASGQWLVASTKLQAANHNSSSLIPHPSFFFAVTTPTAVVTDLGTEFGVEVDESGSTTSHVFRGSIKVRTFPHLNGGGAGGEGNSVVLHANESARVEKVKDSFKVILVSTPPMFARRMRDQPKQLDLLDVVAGGIGTGHSRERGIDPSSGKQDTWFTNEERTDDHTYHRVAWNPLIDGVFIPYAGSTLDPKPWRIQLDSSGNYYDKFSPGRLIDGKKHFFPFLTYTLGSIWSRAAVRDPSDNWSAERGWIYAIDNEREFMPEGRGFLAIHSSTGITFDLAAVRKTHDARPSRLRATVGLGDGPRKYPEVIGMADLWIFIDGRLKWNRMDICRRDGAIKVDVPIGAADRFLTIVSTSGRNGKAYDWLVLGDPVLNMTPAEEEQTISGNSVPKKENQPAK